MTVILAWTTTRSSSTRLRRRCTDAVVWPPLTIWRSRIRAMPATALRQIDKLDLGGGGGDAIVVGQEPLGLVKERVADAAVDLVRRLEEGADVELEQSGAVLVVDVGENAAWDGGEICGVVGGLGGLGGETRERPGVARQ